jgi:transcriptional regulator with XRE-family HTH domain
MVESQLRNRIGASVRRERTRRTWSAAELARRAGISKAGLSQLEGGTGNPSVETLWAIATALGVPFSALVDPGDEGPTVIRAGDAPEVVAGSATYSAALLSACPPGARRDLYVVRAEPGQPRLSAPHQAGTVEHVVLMSGSALAGPVEDAQDLGPGDYIVYRGDLPHTFEARSTGTSALLVSELS